MTLHNFVFPYLKLIRYGEACLDKSEDAVKNSDFCKCLWNYKDRYENEVCEN